MYLVKNVKLFDPQPMGKVDILVTNDRVAAVGNDLHPQIPGLTVIDGTGKTAVPGFIDQHVHVTGGGGEGGFNSRTPELMLSTVIKAGVTTLVGLLGTDSYTKSGKCAGKDKRVQCGWDYRLLPYRCIRLSASDRHRICQQGYCIYKGNSGLQAGDIGSPLLQTDEGGIDPTGVRHPYGSIDLRKAGDFAYSSGRLWKTAGGYY